MKAAIIGLPQAGKTTLFHAMVGASATSRGALSIGTVKVPDARLDRLAEMYNPRRVVHATLEVVEANAPAIGKPGSGGLDAAFLNLVRPMDAFLLVLRAFDEEGLDEPARDAEAVLSELILSDLMVVENRIGRIGLDQKKGKPVSAEELRLLERARGILDEGRLLREDPELCGFSAFQHFAFLTARPILLIVNVAERDLAVPAEAVVARFALPVRGLAAFPCCARAEQEIADLSPEERAEFRQALGVRDPILDVVVRELYRVMGLVSFLTVGEDEVRAWPIRAGTPAPQAAGVVHSDIERGFIRAEVVRYDDLVELGSEAAARRAGRYRLEGRDYVIQDGDVVHFRFAV